MLHDANACLRAFLPYNCVKHRAASILVVRGLIGCFKLIICHVHVEPFREKVSCLVAFVARMHRR